MRGSLDIVVGVDTSDDALLALLDATVAELHVRYPDYVAEPLVPDSEYFVAVLDGVPVGCVALHTLTDRELEIKRLYVAPEGRRRGVAAALIGALEARAAERGARSVILETGTRQPEAIALYQALGYTPAIPYGEFVGSPLSRFFGKEL